MCKCVSLGSDSLESVEIIVKLGMVMMVTASRHHNINRFIILTLTIIQGHTYRNHENKKCLIISESIQLQAMPIKFAMIYEDSPTKE